MDVLFAVQSHLNLHSKPEASSHIHSNSEARVSASRLRLNIVMDFLLLYVAPKTFSFSQPANGPVGPAFFDHVVAKGHAFN
jgi:hypothetical protein